jgi:hypothetical protein
MPQPLKPPELRQRRNKDSTAAVLTAMPQRTRPPKLPQRDGHVWHSLTVAWWKDIWQSPMAPEFLKADYHGLYILAELVDRFWLEPTEKLAAEIRQQRQCFGLTPLDRRRLQWTVQRVEEGEKRGQRPPAEDVPARDPREFLRALS